MKPCLIALMLLIACSPLLAQSHRNDRAIVVPAKKIAVDANLADWDLSGSVQCFYDEALRPKFSVDVAFMYDADALYLAAHFVDDTPMTNRHDPAVEPNLGWAGDSLQVRLCSDPKAAYPLTASNSDRICHLTMWQYTDKALPVLHLAYGMDMHGSKVLAGKESGLAFAADKDGKGWTLEGRVPWALLNAADSQPKANDRLALVIQPLWGDASGWKHALSFNDIIREAGFSFQGTEMWGQAIFSEHGNLKKDERPAGADEKLLPLTLQLPAFDSQAVSLSSAVYGADGVLVRTLPVQTLSAGAKSLPKEIRWDGLDDDGRPLPAGSYTMKALTHRGIEQKWLASLHTAGTPPWRTDDGRGAWGGDHAPPIAAASDAERVYLGWGVCEAGVSVVAVDPASVQKESAQKIWGQSIVLELGINLTAMASDGERVFVGQDGWHWGESQDAPSVAGIVMWDAKTGKPVNFPFGKRTIEIRRWDGRGKQGMNLRGLAVRGDVLYVSMHHDDEVLEVNWKTGEVKQALTVDGPSGVAVDRNGTLIVAAGRTVVWDKAVDQAFSDAYGVAVDADGNVYVTDQGDAMQVKVFDANGKLIRTIGKKGGRPDLGRFDPLGMYKPTGIAVCPRGRIWVTETDNSPRRVSVWGKDGSLVGDLLGPGAYAVEGIADGEKPEWINTHNTLFEVDYKTGAKKTLSTLIRSKDNQIAVEGHMGRALKFRHATGRTYLAWPGHHIIVIYRLDDDLAARPVAATGWLKDVHIYGFKPEHLPEAVREQAWANKAAYCFTWADANDDTLMQPGEMIVEQAKVAPWGHYWGSWTGQDMTIWSSDRHQRIFRVPVMKWLPNGAPVYPKPSEQDALFTIPDAASIDHVRPGKDCVYVLNQIEGKGGAISKYTLDGKRLWSYRRTWLGFGLDSPLSQPGDLPGVMKFIGDVPLDAGGFLFAVNCYFGSFGVLSDDGLWATSLCKDNRYGPKADASTVWPENFSGWLYRNKDNGKAYFIAGDTDTRIWEVTGFETIRTVTGKLSVSQADYQKALDVVLRKQGGTTEQPPIVMQKLTPAIDGKLDEWPMKDAAVIKQGDRDAAKAMLSYDDANLYAAFDVADDSPMKNAGTDAALLFKTGDSCNVNLAGDPTANPKRNRPAKGDMRLLFAEMDGKPVCVLYQPVLSVGTQQRRVLSSPTGVETFDFVAIVPDARVSISRTQAGYKLEAAVPLKALGFAPQPGTISRADLGVIFSDAGGSRNALRVYYANRNTAIVNDIPSEARLEPQYWGVLQVK